MSEQERFDLAIFYFAIINKDVNTAISDSMASDFKPFEIKNLLNSLTSKGYINTEKKNGKIYYVPTDKSISEYGK